MLFTGSLPVSISAAVSVARCNDEDGYRYEAAYDSYDGHVMRF